MNKLMDTSKELIKENNALKEKDYQMKIKNSTLKGELEENIRKYIRQNKVRVLEYLLRRSINKI